MELQLSAILIMVNESTFWVLCTVLTVSIFSKYSGCYMDNIQGDYLKPCLKIIWLLWQKRHAFLPWILPMCVTSHGMSTDQQPIHITIFLQYWPHTSFNSYHEVRLCVMCQSITNLGPATILDIQSYYFLCQKFTCDLHTEMSVHVWHLHEKQDDSGINSIVLQFQMKNLFKCK